MPKTPEFATWISNMANSIEDKSILNKALGCGCVKTSNTQTAMQIRMSFADMLVPSIEDEGNALDWMEAFSGVLVSGTLVGNGLIRVIGRDKSDQYYDDQQSVRWVKEFRIEIMKGWVPE